MIVRLRFLIGLVVCIGVSSRDKWYTDAIESGGKDSGGGQREGNRLIVPYRCVRKPEHQKGSRRCNKAKLKSASPSLTVL